VYGFATEQVLMPMIVGFSLGSATTLFVAMLLFRTGRLPFVVASIQDFFSNRHIRP
jgi:ABC-type enterobactin transport system permease subunit